MPKRPSARDLLRELARQDALLEPLADVGHDRARARTGAPCRGSPSPRRRGARRSRGSREDRAQTAWRWSPRPNRRATLYCAGARCAERHREPRRRVRAARAAARGRRSRPGRRAGFRHARARGSAAGSRRGNASRRRRHRTRSSCAGGSSGARREQLLVHVVVRPQIERLRPGRVGGVEIAAPGLDDRERLQCASAMCIAPKPPAERPTIARPARVGIVRYSESTITGSSRAIAVSHSSPGRGRRTRDRARSSARPAGRRGSPACPTWSSACSTKPTPW